MKHEYTTTGGEWVVRHCDTGRLKCAGQAGFRGGYTRVCIDIMSSDELWCLRTSDKSLVAARRFPTADCCSLNSLT